MKYRVKFDFYYDPAGRADNPEVTKFCKGEIYEFEPYTGKFSQPGEMVLLTHISPENNNDWIWRPGDFDIHFEPVGD